MFVDLTCNRSIHDYSVLTKIYFENVLCLSPVTSKDGRTEQGIRVSLGDNGTLISLMLNLPSHRFEIGDPETTDFLIYGQLLPDPSQDHLPSTSSVPPQSLHILAARILSKPPPPVVRPPRPDDPTPRKPPTQISTSKRKRELSGMNLDFGSSAKRAKAKNEEDEQVRMARDVMFNMPKPGALGKEVRMGGKDDALFKVPEVPSRPLGRSYSESSVVDTDVFGDITAPLEPKGKSRALAVEKSGSDELEKANKIVSPTDSSRSVEALTGLQVIKQAAVSCLSRHGIRKGQPDFNELYQSIYRGVQFASVSVVVPKEVHLAH